MDDLELLNTLENNFKPNEGQLEFNRNDSKIINVLDFNDQVGNNDKIDNMRFDEEIKTEPIQENSNS